MNRCTNCRSTSLFQLSSDVTCTDCGVEQNLGNFISEINVQDRVWYQRDFVKHDDNITSFVNSKLNIEDSEIVCEICQSLFMDYMRTSIIKTENNKISAYSACVYLAIKNYTSLSGRDLEYIAARVQILQKDIVKYVKDISIVLSSHERWKNISDMHFKKVSINQSYINEILPHVCKLKQKEFVKNTHIVFENLKKHSLLIQSCKENSVYSAVFYMINRKLHGNLKLKLMSAVCTTTDATTLSIVRKLENVQGLFQ